MNIKLNSKQKSTAINKFIIIIVLVVPNFSFL
jgi:hypothetical protein